MEAEALRRELANGELEREASTSFTDLEAGTYNVLIYDVGVDGTFDLDKSLYDEQFESKNLLPIEPVPTSTSVSPGMTSICHVIHHFHFLYHVHGRYAVIPHTLQHHSGISLVLISSCPAPSGIVPTPSSVDDALPSKYHCPVCLY